MKFNIYLAIHICTFLILCSSSFAITPEQNCQAQKNIIAGRYAECKFRAESGLPRSIYGTPKSQNRRCKARFEKRWQRIINQTTEAGAVCLDAPLTSADFIAKIDPHVEELAGLYGKGASLSRPVKRCRGIKSVISGRYEMCKFRNESRFAKHQDLTKYNNLSLRCESLLETRWDLITKETAEAGAVCFDNSLTRAYFQSLIDNHVNEIATILAGNAPVAISLTGSPLELIENGATGEITITNTSTRVTVTNITSDFSGTALDGKVTEVSNTCSNLAPGASCILGFAGTSLVSTTDFTIHGSNTLPVTASISVVNAPVATLSVTGAPLLLTTNGPTGSLTITNTSALITANNITSNFTGTALDGNVTETGNTCASLPPSASCSLTFTPGNTVVTVTNFTIQGSNTLAVTTSLAIQSGSTLISVSSSSGPSSGGAGVTLTGTGLTGATSVTFDGISATSVNVVNSTTVTAVTPAHSAGVVDVVINTPAGDATLVNGYTYLPTAVGQSSSGGTIACLNGGLENLIATTADNSSAISWGGTGTAIGAGAQSNTDGASNTATIVATLGAGTYAAQLCNDYEVDSQGNTPCQPGNICYNDWFLPALIQLDCLYLNKVSIGGFSSASYWSSTEFSSSPSNDAASQEMLTGTQITLSKALAIRTRCVRAFVP